MGRRRLCTRDDFFNYASGPSCNLRGISLAWDTSKIACAAFSLSPVRVTVSSILRNRVDGVSPVYVKRCGISSTLEMPHGYSTQDQLTG